MTLTPPYHEPLHVSHITPYITPFHHGLTSARPTPLLLPTHTIPAVVGSTSLPLGSLLPTQLKPRLAHTESTGLGDQATLKPAGVGSAIGTSDGQIPALSHSLDVGEGRRVLCLEVDERFIYAGCQGRDNEIVVS
jgi:hypothetical protein